MPKASKTPYHHGDLRQALVDAGLKVLRDEGLEALGLRRVAREASVSPAAPYRHFKDKRSLLAAISEHGFRELHKRLETSNTDNPGDLDASGHVYQKFAIENPEIYRLMFTKNVMCDEDIDETLKKASANAFLALASTIEAGMQNGKIATTDQHQLALSSWALCHGVAMLVIDGILGGGPFADLTPEEILDQSQSYFRNGWQPKT